MEGNKTNLPETAPNADNTQATENVNVENQTTSQVDVGASTVDVDADVNTAHQQEMADLLQNINNDLDEPKEGLTQEEIAAKKKQQDIEARTQEIRKKTLGDNASRVASNGLSRVAIAGGIAAVLIGGGALMYFSGNDEQVQSDLNGSVDLPKANVSGNATLTKEQAEFERRNQQAQASNAEQNGETYIPSVIVERDADQQYLVGDGMVPGVKVEVDANGRPVNPNNFIADFDPALANNGGMSNSAHDTSHTAPSNTFQNGQQNGGHQNGGQQQQVQQAVVTPTVPQDRYASSMTALETAGKNVEDWQNGIADYWLQKAAQTEEVAQTAFTEQLNNLLSTKPNREQASVGNSNRYVQYKYSVPKNDSGTTSSNGNYGYKYAEQTSHGSSVGSSGNQNGGNSANEKVLIRAGTTYVTQLISEVNTDEGVEVLARIASGPYKDAKLIGTVRQANKNVQFVFNRLIPKKGDELKIEAVAREIGTNKMGMADEIKTHTFKRYAGMVLASGMKGYGEAWSDLGTTTSTSIGTVQTKTKPNDKEIAGSIIGEMGESVSQDIMRHSVQPTTYITYSGKVFNLYFNQNVTEKLN